MQYCLMLLVLRAVLLQTMPLALAGQLRLRAVHWLWCCSSGCLPALIGWCCPQAMQRGSSSRVWQVREVKQHSLHVSGLHYDCIMCFTGAIYA
jgi:hypothetical protein